MIEFVKDIFEHAKQKEQCIDFSFLDLEKLDLSELFKNSEFSAEYLLQ